MKYRLLGNSGLRVSEAALGTMIFGEEWGWGSVKDEARLSPDERLALIAQLWDSLDDQQVQLTPDQQAELERRFTTLDHDRTHSVTWETLKAELEQRCP